jgi:hypothetical protein
MGQFAKLACQAATMTALVQTVGVTAEQFCQAARMTPHPRPCASIPALNAACGGSPIQIESKAILEPETRQGICVLRASTACEAIPDARFGQ